MYVYFRHTPFLFMYYLVFLGNTQPLCFATARLNVSQTFSSRNSKCIVPFLKPFTRKKAHSNHVPYDILLSFRKVDKLFNDILQY